MWLVVGVYLAPVFIATVSQGRDRYDEDLSLHRRWFGCYVEGGCGLVRNLSRSVNNFSLDNFM